MTEKDKSEQNRPPVEVHGVSKSFGDQKVLEGIDLTAERGEILVILGRSGGGKSVLLRCLIGLEKPDAGSIRIAGAEIQKLSHEELNETRKKVGFLFQQAALYDSMSVEQNVAFPLTRHMKLKPEERRDRVRKLLDSVGMGSELDKAPGEISGGMKKRAALARALALEPEILMFDEPTAGLDPITAAEIAELILKLKKERSLTSIVVTHDLHTARAIADRLIMLHEGKVAVEGAYEELEKSRHPFVAQFLKEAA